MSNYFAESTLIMVRNRKDANTDMPATLKSLSTDALEDRVMTENNTMEIYESRHGKFELKINGRDVDMQDAYLPEGSYKKSDKGYHELQISSDEMAKQVLNFKLGVFPIAINKITFNHLAAFDKESFDNLYPSIRRIKNSANNLYEEGFIFEYEVSQKVSTLNSLNAPIKFVDVMDSVGKAYNPGFYSKLQGAVYRLDTTDIVINFVMYHPCRDLDEQLNELIEKYAQISEQIKRETFELILQRPENSVEIVLDLPPDVRVACEQYLLYFVQFLKDLGVDASSELKHEGSKVLFSVTPEDKDQALDKISKALEIYLHLSSGTLTNPTGEFSIEISSLKANVLHLQSQLELAEAKNQIKDAALQLQQITIQHQQLLLSENVFASSIKNITPHQEKKEDKEDILGGAVTLVPLKGKGFDVNTPKLWRWLKDWMNEK